ncbi:DUF2252 family protein [Plastoroseomonas arctica]|uniref:DUF2252 domain-containing protein n=1 Tax=Plastoroseomonas arctica TaxID=1509237 RepID=A0AAF1JX75_9PROT|nr:DUF2252 family protein [Plastoroseomonas arctica]MBR0655942.1 DUF2252 domain-containing protein [Plastoroseomonas arctica]
MQDIDDAVRAHERWMRGLLGRDLVVGDLDAKHRGMRKSPFIFLRATYFRWAETILETCPELGAAPKVLAIGDIHVENFGTWRDAEGRLVWGVNDFDEAAPMPYALDLVRLCTSAMLAKAERAPEPKELAAAVLRGYGAGLDAPAPVVLEQGWKWLRAEALVAEADRAKLWRRFEALRDGPVRKRFRDALRGAMPVGAAIDAVAPRVAGMGSLGRPHFVARATWRGGPLLREVKALLPSAWSRAHRGGDATIHAGVIAEGAARAPDPFFEVTNGLAVRRLSPNNRKIALGDMAGPMLSGRMLEAMGRDVAGCHASDPARLDAVRADVGGRKAGWLARAARDAARAVIADHKAYRERG